MEKMEVKIISTNPKSVEGKSSSIPTVQRKTIGRDVAARIFMGLNYDDCASCGLLDHRWKDWFDHFLTNTATELQLQSHSRSRGTSETDKASRIDGINYSGLPRRSVEFLTGARTSTECAVSAVRPLSGSGTEVKTKHLLSARFTTLIENCGGRLRSLAVDLNLSNLSDGKQQMKTIVSNCPKLQSLSLSITSSPTEPSLTSSSSPPSSLLTESAALIKFLQQLTELKLVRGTIGKDELKSFVLSGSTDSAATASNSSISSISSAVVPTNPASPADPVGIFVMQLMLVVTDRPGYRPANLFSALKKLTIESTDLKSATWIDFENFCNTCVDVEELSWRCLSRTTFSSVCWHIGFKKLERFHLSNWLIGSGVEFLAWIHERSTLTHLTMENVPFEDVYWGAATKGLGKHFPNKLLLVDFGKQCPMTCENSRLVEEFISCSSHLVVFIVSIHTSFTFSSELDKSENHWTSRMLANLKTLKDLRHLTIYLADENQIEPIRRIIHNLLSPLPPAFELNLLVTPTV